MTEYKQPETHDESPDDKATLDHVIDKMTPKELGDLAIKFASDTAYAAAGFADVVAEKAREFVEKQRATIAEATPEAGTDPAKAFLDQLSQQVNKLVEDMGHTYKDLADRGRDAVSKLQQQAGVKVEPKDVPGPFDIDEAADVASDVVDDVVDAADDVVEAVVDEVKDATDSE